MKCDVCKENDACIAIHQFNSEAEESGEIHLCQECAIERGVNPEGQQLGMLFSGLINAIVSGHLQLQQTDTRACPVCGRTIQQITQTATAGCPECYNVFQTDIKKISENLGVHGHYSGTMPSRFTHTAAVASPPADERVTLRNKLAEAAEAENYEQAAYYRDRLRELEGMNVAVCRTHEHEGCRT